MACRPNNTSYNDNSNDKNVYVGSIQGPFKKDITIILVVSHTKYIDTELDYLTICGKFKRSKI